MTVEQDDETIRKTGGLKNAITTNAVADPSVKLTRNMMESYIQDSIKFRNMMESGMDNPE